MEPPDRYEWLHAEQERQTRDPAGLAAIGTRWNRYYRWKLGAVLAIVPPGLLMSALVEGRDRSQEAIGLIGFGLFELALALFIWRRIKPRTPMISGMAWGALFFGLLILPLGIWH